MTLREGKVAVTEAIRDVMRRRTLIAVNPGTRVGDAEHLATREGVRHLLVMRHGTLVGVACLCDLREAAEDEPVGNFMSRPVLTARPETSLREAVERMRQHAVGCLPVLEGIDVVGIVTRGDLRRAGLSDQEGLGGLVCVACGAFHDVRPFQDLEHVAFCLECLERSSALEDDEELGVSG